MYRIIGADGKEYSPVTLLQLRQWVAEGRINSQTRVQLAGATDWNQLGNLPEFADIFASPTPGVPPVEPPVTTPVNADVLTVQLLARDYQIDIFHCLGRAWKMVLSDFWLLVGASFVAWLIAGAGPIGWILGGPVLGGLYGLYLKKIRGQTATFSDAFVGFSVAFVPLMLLYIVKSLLTLAGVLLCLVPGIYLGVSWVFALALAFDKQLDFWPAMELSRKVVGKHWWMVLWLLLVCGLVAAAGLLACCVGVFFTATIAQVALLYAYEDIFGTPPATNS